MQISHLINYIFTNYQHSKPALCMYDVLENYCAIHNLNIDNWLTCCPDDATDHDKLLYLMLQLAAAE